MEMILDMPEVDGFTPYPLNRQDLIYRIVDLVGQCHDSRKAYAVVNISSQLVLSYATNIEVTEYPHINDYCITFASVDDLSTMFADKDSMEDLTKMVSALERILA
jgi:hypothetical protein